MDQNVFKIFARVKCILCWVISPLNKDCGLIFFSFSKRNFMITKQCNFYRLQRTQSASKKLCYESDKSQELTWPSCCSILFSTFYIITRKWGTSAIVHLAGTVVASRENEILRVWNFLQICDCVKTEKVCECLCVCVCGATLIANET